MKTENPHALKFSQERQSEELLPEFSIGMKEARAKTTQVEAHVATFYSTTDHDRQSRLLTDERNYPLEHNNAGSIKGPQFSVQKGSILSTNYTFNAMIFTSQ